MTWILIGGAALYFAWKGGYLGGALPAAADNSGIPNGQSYGQNPSTAGPTTPISMNNSPYMTPGNVPLRPTAFFGPNFNSVRAQALAANYTRVLPATALVVPPGGSGFGAGYTHGRVV